MNKPWVEFHLRQALEQLQHTLSELRGPDFTEVELGSDLEEAYSHLNIAWHSRGEPVERTANLTEEDYHRWRAFPSDIYLGP